MKPRPRKVLTIPALTEVQKLRAQGVAVTSIVKLLELNIGYRTAQTIIQADSKGWYNATRPEWLRTAITDAPVQLSPEGWRLLNGYTAKGAWHYEDN